MKKLLLTVMVTMLLVSCASPSAANQSGSDTGASNAKVWYDLFFSDDPAVRQKYLGCDIEQMVESFVGTIQPPGETSAEVFVIKVCNFLEQNPELKYFLVAAATPIPLDGTAYMVYGIAKAGTQIRYVIVAALVSAPGWYPIADVIGGTMVDSVLRPADSTFAEELAKFAAMAGATGEEETRNDILSDVAAGDPSGKPPSCPPTQKPGLPSDAILAASYAPSKGGEKYIIHVWATAGGEVIGKATMNFAGMMSDGITSVVIPHVFVYPQFRDKGMATQMMERINQAWIQKYGGEKTAVNMENWNSSYAYSCFMKGKVRGPDYNDPGGGVFPTYWLIPPK